MSIKTLYSKQFDDIYFSPDDGLAEAKHVFLGGNSLPEAWGDKARFVIAETGFGTGLNFLAAWTLFEKTAKPDQHLHYISFERYPLSWDEISRALAPWRDAFGGRIDRLRSLYPLRVAGFHRVMINEQVTLTLVFDDVNTALPQLDVPGGVDAWFLDGFAPSKNPDMWSDVVFSEMARLAHDDTSFATFTVAGAVRRGLEEAGFSVEKCPGFGKKKEMLTGQFTQALPPLSPRKRGEGNGEAVSRGERKAIAIIGGGLAGTAAAFVLRRCGVHPVLFEAEEKLASGASGNELGLYNPRLSALRSPESDFYSAAFAQTVRILRELQRDHDIQFNPCGSFHLFTDEDKEKRLRGAAQNWWWHKSHMHVMTASAASQRTGLKQDKEGLFLPESGAVSPVALCHAYADDVDVRLQATPSLKRDNDQWLVGGEEFDAVILACGAAAKEFTDLDWLPVHTVRGQVSSVIATKDSASLKSNLCFGGYISPAQKGTHMLGATFQQWDESTEITEEDHRDNLERLAAIMPQLKDLEITDGRAALRTSSKDRFPLVGSVPDAAAWKQGEENNIPGLYVSTAHGSHGIVSSLAAAHLLADMITGQAASLPQASVQALAPARFLRRAKKKGQL